MGEYLENCCTERCINTINNRGRLHFQYSQSIDRKSLKANWLDIDFKENKDGTFKTIGIHAKKARGLMSRYIVENRIENIEDIKKFDIAGYSFNTELSKENLLCFTR